MPPLPGCRNHLGQRSLGLSWGRVVGKIPHLNGLFGITILPGTCFGLDFGIVLPAGRHNTPMSEVASEAKHVTRRSRCSSFFLFVALAWSRSGNRSCVFGVREFAALFPIFCHASGPPQRRLKCKIPFRVIPPEAESLKQLAFHGA